MSERTLHSKDFEHSEIEHILGKLVFDFQIVLEFYINFSRDMGDLAIQNF